MIVDDLGYELVDETDFGTDNARTLRLLMRVGCNVVIQCPALSRICHEFRHDQENAVVWMVRDSRDCERSQGRIGWPHAGEEAARYGMTLESLDGKPISQFKQEWWDSNQKPLFDDSLGDGIEVEYESLREHRLWVDKRHRRRFGPKQVRRNPKT